MGEQAYRAGGELQPGTLVGGRFRIGELLGCGGMGAVYEAEHVELGRRVAIKTLLPEATRGENVSARLIHEARAAAAIGHPGIVDVFDLVEHDGTTCVVMELLKGEELHDRIQARGALPIDFVVRMGREVASAIDAAHAHGIVHRDLKPRNVFIARDPRLGETFKVLDFGIAKLGEETDLRLSTKSGQVVGTPAYMAPERLKGEAGADARVDVYAIGALMYEGLTGEPPFSGATYPELVLRITTERAPPLRSLRRNVPAALAEIVERALQKDPEARQQSASALVEELETIRTALPPDSGVHLATATMDSAIPPATDASPDARAPRGRKRAVALGLAAAVVAAVIAAGGSDAPAPQTATPTAPPVVPTVATSAGPEPVVIPTGVSAETAALEPQPAAAAAPTATDETPAAAATRTVRITSTPRGAGIWVDGERRCTAPCVLSLPDRETRVTAALKGHARARQTLRTPLPERVDLSLRARPSPKSDDGLPPLLPR